MNAVEISQFENRTCQRVKTTDIVLIRGCFVYPPGRVAANSGVPPLGLAYLASYLRGNGFSSISIIDSFGEAPFNFASKNGFELYGLSNEETLALIPEEARILGFSCTFTKDWINLKHLICQAKQRFPNAITVLGGEHATALSQYSLDSCSGLDYVVRGEGEIPLLKLVEYILCKKGEITQIDGLVYRAPDGIIENPGIRNRFPDKIPWPAWDMVPFNNYLDNGLGIVSAKGNRTLPLLASRGCPYVCKFCSNEQMWGTLYRTRDPKDIVNELKDSIHRHKINRFELYDLTFIVNRKWFVEFARLLIAANLNLHWDLISTRAEAINEEVVDLLVRSGCTNICLAPDSGSEDQIEEMQKKVDLNQVSNCVKLILKSPMKLKINLIVGYPNESHWDIIQTIFYGIKLSALGASSVVFFKYAPYPGSYYFNQLKERKLIPDFGEEFDRFQVLSLNNEMLHVISFNKNISSPVLRLYWLTGFLFSYLAYLLLNPLEIPLVIRRVVSGMPQTALEAGMVSVLQKFSNGARQFFSFVHLFSYKKN